jgi:hypothetical protein
VEGGVLCVRDETQRRRRDNEVGRGDARSVMGRRL